MKKTEINLGHVVNQIKKSKKYKYLYLRTIERIVNSTSGYKNSKELEAKSRLMLHQIWGYYYSTYPNFSKLLKTFKESTDVMTSLEDMLRHHASTKERVPFLSEFYSEIFDITGIPESIVDIGCGFNPLTIPWMKLPVSTKYFSYDIDEGSIDFMKEIYAVLQSRIPDLPDEVSFGIKDIFEDNFPPSDVVFLFKILMDIELQEKGSARKVLDNLDCKYLVITFPTTTLTGKNKGMKKFYEELFTQIMMGSSYKILKLEFQTELVYILKK